MIKETPDGDLTPEEVWEERGKSDGDLKGWRERLDEEFPVVKKGHHHYRRERYLTRFIEAELSQCRKETIEEVEKRLPKPSNVPENYGGKIHFDCLDEVLLVLSAMKKE